MNYFSRLKGICGRFIKSFRYDYEPPNTQCNPPQQLLTVIRDCSNQGKLLIINLTLNGEKINIPLDFPEEDYIVYSAPFNSKCTFNYVRNFQIDTLPFVGVFFCRTKEVSDVQFLIKIVNLNDLNNVAAIFRRLSRELYERRDRYVITQESRIIINDQDQQYNEILLEAQKNEEIQRQQEIRETEIEKNKQAKIKHALKRYNSMPAPPPRDDPKTVSVKFMITGKQAKVREFRATDTARLLYDFVSIDYAPETPKILYGFPQRTLSQSDLDRTLSDLKFAKKETVIVQSDDDEEEEEEEVAAK